MAAASLAALAALPEIVVSNDLRLEPDARITARFVVQASHVTIDGAGAVLIGPGEAGNPVSLEGDASWQRTVTGQVQLDRIDALGIGVDSFGGDPFTIWLDGLAVD